MPRFDDDSEHEAGRTLLEVLSKVENYNKVVFMVRYYGGQRLGKSRFDIMTEMATSAVETLPPPPITEVFMTPKRQSSFTQSSAWHTPRKPRAHSQINSNQHIRGRGAPHTPPFRCNQLSIVNPEGMKSESVYGDLSPEETT